MVERLLYAQLVLLGNGKLKLINLPIMESVCVFIMETSDLLVQKS